METDSGSKTNEPEVQGFDLHLPYLPMYKSTFQSLKIGPKNRPRLIHGSKTEMKKVQDKLA